MLASDTTAMEQDWLTLLSRLGVPADRAKPLFTALASRYQEPHRHYHNLEHIAEVLRVIEQLADGAVNRDAILLAAWYHDAVYDPKAKDNEEQSAVLMRSHVIDLSLPSELAERGAAIIRATAHQEIADCDAHTAVLLDADLAILASDAKCYHRYAEAIRQEYSWVVDADYRDGRSTVLEAFLRRERIYRTDQMHADCEETARRNLREELQRLQHQAFNNLR